jgi:type IV pilus assembly protein PilY1
MKLRLLAASLTAVALTGLSSPASAQTIIQDNFTGSTTAYPWVPFLGACLTAGDPAAGSSIPPCMGLSSFTYYGSETLVGGDTGLLPDTAANGGGALRFTNGSPGGYAQAGGVISNFVFPSTQGLQITFTTVTYRGDSGGAGGDGADGIGFFLVDAGPTAPYFMPFDVGAFGGSLGYTCSNVNNDPKLHSDGSPRAYDGIPRGYLGLGIDEYGNFLNQGDNTASGYGYQPGRIGLRGAGSIVYYQLALKYPTYYPPGAVLTQAQKASAVQNTCRTGLIWDYSNPALPVATAMTIPDYAPIPNAYQVLPAGTLIANESAMTRSGATPITYLLKITAGGLLSFSYSINNGAYQPVITAQNITTGNGPLPANFRFGFTGSTGGSTNIHEVICFQVQPSDTAASSAGLNEKQTAQVQTGTQVYFAFYNPANWSGSLTAQPLVVDAVTGLVSISAVAKWDASCGLTGLAAAATCVPTGVVGPVAAQAPGARTILTYNGSTGIPLQFASLPTAMQNSIDAGDTPPNNANRVNFLRGDRSNEQNALGVGQFRQRAGILGDIINSSPTWVGGPGVNYPLSWSDRISAGGAFPENAGPTYAAFATTNGTRLNVVYSGANDGLVHGFRSGSYNGNVYVDNATTPNDGLEVLAYMPYAVFKSIHNSGNAQIDYSSPQYGHSYFVDAPPGTGDLYYNGAWHTWLVGGLGAGGAAIYALDITNPSNFAESNAAALVIGEWGPSNLSCVGNGGCGANLGNTNGVPQVRRFHNGQWGFVFGNGLGAANGAAGVFVGLVNPGSGTVSFYYLDSGGAAAGNGIAYATAADLDGDHIVDYIYAGDAKGHVWRFDVTSNNPSSWAVSANQPLFTTPGGKPITTKLVVASSPGQNGGGPQVMVDFGTGRQYPLTNSTPTTYAAGAQALYGIWDWNMASWNTKGSIQYKSLAAPQTISTANLVQQTTSLTSNTAFRTVTNNPICWTTCSSGGTQFGWYLNLPGSNEQVIYSPVLEVGAFLVNTTIPTLASAFNCTPASATGWTMAISPLTGGAFNQSFFGDSGGHFVNINGQVVSGAALSGTGSVSIVTTGGAAAGTFLVTQTVSGVGIVLPINPLANASGSRLTWIEKR